MNIPRRQALDAIFGAVIALRVRDHLKKQRGEPTPEDYDRFVKEAVKVVRQTNRALHRRWAEADHERVRDGGSR